MSSSSSSLYNLHNGKENALAQRYKIERYTDAQLQIHTHTHTHIHKGHKFSLHNAATAGEDAREVCERSEEGTGDGEASFNACKHKIRIQYLTCIQ